MATNIKVTPEQLRGAARDIGDKATDYQTQFEALYTRVENMSNLWKGADNLKFTTQIDGFKQDFRNMYNLMVEYQGFLNDSANTYDRVQGQIIEDAQRLVN